MKKYYILLVILSLTISSCDQDFLEAKPDNALLIPETLADFESLLNNIITFNTSAGIHHIASDDFIITDNGFLALTNATERNSYTWAKDVYEGSTQVNDWNNLYRQVFYANNVLDGLKKLDPAVNPASYNRIKGGALFHRAFAFFNLAQIFCAPYSEKTKNEPGIPLRLISDVNIMPQRGTVAAVYQQIVADLIEASSLVPVTVSFKTHPCQGAAYAMLSKVFLSMSDYTESENYASKALQLNSKLVDYNTLSPAAARPIPAALPNGNDEVLFYSNLITYTFTTSTLVYANPDLYSLYTSSDLRKTIFFTDGGAGRVTYKGSYTGNVRMFSGLATDEVYLDRAESRAQAGNIAGALQDLNTLLVKRHRTNQFVALVAQTKDQALNLVLQERRKELVARGVRWTDLRRLNQDPSTAVTVRHTVAGVIYELIPGDKRYIFPLPDYEITLSGLTQNPR